MSKTVIQTAATSEPVSLSEARAHLRLADAEHDEDTWLAQRIVAARSAAEDYCWSKFVSQTWDQYFDRFESPMRLAFSPVSSITSITYTDGNGDSQTLAATVYELGTEDGLGVVRLKYNQVWPADVRTHPDNIVVRFVCGYGAVAAVPQRIKQAILLYVSHAYEFREGEQPLSPAFQQMLGPYLKRGLQ